MDKQEPIFDSAATGAEPKADAASESKTEPNAESRTIDADAVAPESAAAEDKVRTFPLAIYKPSTQYRRFALLAASLAIAAALGGMMGSLSTYSFATPKAEPVVAADPAPGLQAALTRVTKDVAALKASIDASSRAASSQISKINERFDRVERAQAEPAAKIAALSETVSRIEKRITAKADAGDITGSVSTAAKVKDETKPAVVAGWVLRDIYRGRALVESSSGLYEIVPGAELPGIGKVQNITQQNGRWVVVTAKGLIVR